MSKKVAADSYQKLLSRIRNEIDAARKKIDYARALAYWNTGKYIHEDILKYKKRAGYGDYLYWRLAADLKMGERTIQRAVQFHREHPIPSPATQLSWSHYTELLSISDKIRRKRLEQWAIQEDIPRDKLRAAIVQSSQSSAEIKGPDSPAPRSTTYDVRRTKLTPKRGQLNIYQSVAAASVPLAKGDILLDCGFNVKTKVSRKAIKTSKIVTSRAKMSFTYRAYVEEIIDGDTLWATVDLGLGNYVTQKLRLRGIDSPELSTESGHKAKRFVEKTLKNMEHIIICSSKSDKYDRYLADVFIPLKPSVQEKAPAAPRPQGAGARRDNYIYLNQQLLDEGLAVGYKE